MASRDSNDGGWSRGVQRARRAARHLLADVAAVLALGALILLLWGFGGL